MEHESINVFINSKSRESGSASDFQVKIPDGLLRLRNSNEYFSLNVIGFYCINTRYNCIRDFNDRFVIAYNMGQGQAMVHYEFRIPEGNPSVDDIVEYFQSIITFFSTGSFYGPVPFSFTYNKITNKFIWKLLDIGSLRNYFLQIENCEDFFGFPIDRRGEYMAITAEGLNSTVPVNINGDETFSLKISGDISFANNNMYNYGSPYFKPSNIIFVKAIDVPPWEIIQYNNTDGGDNFKYKLNDRMIDNFSLSVVNQDDEIIPKFAEYVLILKFTKHTVDVETGSMIAAILDYVRQIYFILGRSLMMPMKSSTKTNKKK